MHIIRLAAPFQCIQGRASSSGVCGWPHSLLLAQHRISALALPWHYLVLFSTLPLSLPPTNQPNETRLVFSRPQILPKQDGAYDGYVVILGVLSFRISGVFHRRGHTAGTGNLPIVLSAYVSRRRRYNISTSNIPPSGCLRKCSLKSTLLNPPCASILSSRPLYALPRCQSEYTTYEHPPPLYLPRSWAGEHHIYEIPLDLRVAGMFVRQGETGLCTVAED